MDGEVRIKKLGGAANCSEVTQKLKKKEAQGINMNRKKREKKNYIKTVRMFSINKFLYAFHAHTRQSRICYNNIKPSYRILNKQMFNK